MAYFYTYIHHIRQVTGIQYLSLEFLPHKRPILQNFTESWIVVSNLETGEKKILIQHSAEV